MIFPGVEATCMRIGPHPGREVGGPWHLAAHAGDDEAASPADQGVRGRLQAPCRRPSARGADKVRVILQRLPVPFGSHHGSKVNEIPYYFLFILLIKDPGWARTIFLRELMRVHKRQ